ncbi:MAG: hypothetical protein JXA37_06575 [Chloroflexia bacterium]|nr:hypothetical protein [Chloroflexia bacterium]
MTSKRRVADSLQFNTQYGMCGGDGRTRLPHLVALPYTAATATGTDATAVGTGAATATAGPADGAATALAAGRSSTTGITTASQPSFAPRMVTGRLTAAGPGS